MSFDIVGIAIHVSGIGQTFRGQRCNIGSFDCLTIGRESVMKLPEGSAFDPETVALMKAALDDAWMSLGSDQQTHASRSQLAERILREASRGERDPARLRASALNGFVPPRAEAG